MSLQNDLPLLVLTERLAVCRLLVEAPQPDWARLGEVSAFLHTNDEFTVVCPERYVPPEVNAERGWRSIKVQGPLDFALVGVIASISTVLAQAGVSVFVLSTFATDYFLVKEDALEQAIQALVQAGFQVNKDVRLSS